MDIKKMKNSFNTFYNLAKKLLSDKSKTLSTIQEGMTKADENKGKLAEIWEKLQLLFSLTTDYAKGNYTNISKGSIIAIVAGLLYFISPLDVVPDFIVALGYLDDAFIIGYVFNKVGKELDKYKDWKIEQEKTIAI